MDNGLVREIRKILPVNTVGRYDLLPIFRHVDLFDAIVTEMSAAYVGKVDLVVAPEAIGWIIGTAIARELGVGFVPIRKHGRLPYPQQAVVSRPFVDYTATTKALELAINALEAGSRVLVVDEWVETGAQVRSCMELVAQLDCPTVGIATIGLDLNEHTKEWIDEGFVSYIMLEV